MKIRGKFAFAVLATFAAVTAVVGQSAFAHGGNNDPNAIHACVNRFGEVRILGFQGLSISGPCPLLGGPWALVHWSITGPSGPSGASGPSGPQGPSGPSGPSGPAGLVAAKQANGQFNGELTSSITGDVVATMNLPPGNWAVYGRVKIVNLNFGSDYFASCRIEVEGVPKDSVDGSTGVGAGFTQSSQILPMMGLATVAGSGLVEIRCNDADALPAGAVNGKILAVQVSTILP
jgi:hypothetical protein